MTELTVILDQMVAPTPGGIGRYAEELTRALIRTAPSGATVSGFVSASPASDYEEIGRRLPGLAVLHRSAFDRRMLSRAWSHGFTRLPGSGLVHAPSQLAPLYRHDRAGIPAEQVVVTIHDVVPWTDPELLTPHGAAWHRRMAARAERYADAVVVPTHAVADQLAGFLDLGERVRVIPSAVSPALAQPRDAAERAVRLGLPERYVLAVGTLEPRKGLDALVRALAQPALAGLPLVHVGAPGWGDVSLASLASEAGLAPERAIELGRIDDADLATVYAHASVFVFPSLREGFGIPVLEAFAAGVPTVISDDPALVEVAAGAAVVVERDDREHYAQRLAEAIAGLLDDPERAASLGLQGRDRAGLFTWRDSAEKVWQLHADL